MPQYLVSFDHVSELIDSDLPSAAAVARAIVKGEGPADNVHLSGYWSLSSPVRRVALVDDSVVADVWHDGAYEPAGQPRGSASAPLASAPEPETANLSVVEPAQSQG